MEEEKEKHTIQCILGENECENKMEYSGGIFEKQEFKPFVDILKMRKKGAPVIAAVAPAIAGQFGDNVTIYQMRSALKKIGFSDMIEVALFADMLTLKEAVEFDHLVNNKQDFMITSCCCPMWVAMVKKVYHNLVNHVSKSVSPMIAAGRVIKKINPNAKVVFIGPCIAKKAEAKEPDLIGDIDFVLTFTELKDMLDNLKINPKDLKEDIGEQCAAKGGRIYARTGGVSEAVHDAIKRMFPEKSEMFSSAEANGVKECKDILGKLQSGDIKADFIEGMGCIGGCVGGPKNLIPKDIGREFVNKLGEEAHVKVSIDSDCMKQILEAIGINNIEDFKDEKKTEIFKRDLS